jgi:hypothetical protein
MSFRLSSSLNMIHLSTPATTCTKSRASSSSSGSTSQSCPCTNNTRSGFSGDNLVHGGSTTAVITTPIATRRTNSYTSRYNKMTSSLVQRLLQLLVLWLVCTSSTTTWAYKDSNMYRWGENPNTHFKMYWKDAANVIQDLSQFQALYVTVHGCVWSECKVDDFDDDGENHDGDEQWYETRTSQFCANAAYSLYGIKKNNFKLVNTCSKGTYINSFFTYGGADTLVKALGLSINTNRDNSRYSPTDDYYATSNTDCNLVEGNGRQRRNLNSNDGDDDNNAQDDQVAAGTSISDLYSGVVATTMGCAANTASKYNKFVLAGFDDQYCSGQHYLKTVDSLKTYNRVIHKVGCHRIWELRNSNTNSNSNNNDENTDDFYNNGGRRQLDSDNNEQDTTMDEDQTHRHLSNDNNNNHYRTYNSVAERLLYHSWACDLSLYPTQCPDPYGFKRKYYNVMKAAANGQPVALAVWNARMRKPIIIVTWLSFFVGVYLIIFSYYIQNAAYIREKGGGCRGCMFLLQRDIVAGWVWFAEQVSKMCEEHRARRAAKSSSKKRPPSKKDKGFMAAIFGGSSKKKSKKKGSKKTITGDRALGRSASSRSLPEEDASVYTEMSDGNYNNPPNNNHSGRSARSSSRKGSANYSSSRTSKAAEAAFAAAAQFDLEQQQHQGRRRSSSRRKYSDHQDILPSSSRGSSHSKHGVSRKRSSSAKSSSARRGTMDPPPTRSSGGTPVRRSGSDAPGRSRSLSSERRVFV